MKQEEFFVRHEFGSDRTTIAAARAAARVPVYGVLDHIRSAHNVGSMFRTADGAGLAELVLCGYTPNPPHRHLAKTALGAVDVVPWRQCATLREAIDSVRERGAQVLAVELTERSVPLYEYELSFPVALVMGNEVDGLNEAAMASCDAVVHLPMYGLKNSLNVSVAFGIAAYEVVRRHHMHEADAIDSEL